MSVPARPSRLCLLLVLALSLVALACSSQPESGGRADADGKEQVRVEGAVSGGGAPSSGDGAPGAMVARTDRELAVHPARGDDAVAQTLPATTGFGSARALLVTAEDDGWLQVLLPVRPNGSTGWVRAADVEVERVDLELRVDLARRTLTLLDAGAVVLTTPAAIGSADAPTPTGRFSVTDKLVTEDAGSAYGPYALGLSGHSDVLTEFAGGDGQIGIHGTNDPGSIGQAVSSGCIRVPNDVITTLNEVLPLGTPVVVE